jgi:predicted nucleic acid-binding Zn ribbon protein
MRGLRKLQAMIPEAVGRDEIARTARAQIALRNWSEIVGEELAKRSSPERYERGTVWVAVTGSAWAREIRMIKDRILQRLREVSGEPDMFKEIRFGVRPINPDVVEEPAPPPIKREKTDTDLSIREIAERRLRNWPDAQGD